MSTIRKLSSRHTSHRSRQSVDIIVIRINHGGTLGMSRPCIMCMKHLNRIKGYKIRYVYYSTPNGEILKEKFSHLIQDGNCTSSSRFR